MVPEIYKIDVRMTWYILKIAPDQYQTQEMWYEKSDNDDKLVEWCSDYMQHKTQKAQTKKELSSVAWHSF